jgi:unsaturated chondroitin disaccharide hydrolase
MRILKTAIVLVTLMLLSFSCTTTPKNKNKFPESELEFAEKQLSLLLENANEANKIPRTITAEGEMHWTRNGFDWTEGFFPGTCWYLYEITKDKKWKVAAEKFQAKFESHKNYTSYHDLGFVFNCSYGNGYEITKNNDFKEVLITAADSLLTRFNPTVGSIISWNVDKGWQSQRGWKFPVIIDNMLNLELLFEASILTENPKYKEAAIAHAKTTLKNHFRADNSSFHVVDYDPETGEVRSKQTAQGYADDSSWARGQAWGVYGYTLCYRYTKNEEFLAQAQKIADYIINYKGMPEDRIPYWDYNAPNIPNEPRDASAAAITVSALIELNGYTNGKYEAAIDKILKSLASEAYTAKLGENHNFILKHSVGSIPHNNEIDVPLNYADYYYVEALLRYQEYNKK